MIFRGPGYSTSLGRSVVRVGENGRLSNLLNPSNLIPELSTTASIEQLEEATLLKRIERQQRTMMLDHYAAMIEQLSSIEQTLEAAELNGAIEGCVRDIRQDAANAFGLFEQGFSRTGHDSLRYKGVCDLSWDTHADHMTQVENTRFFWYLGDIMRDLENRQTNRGTALRDEVVVVVFFF